MTLYCVSTDSTPDTSSTNLTVLTQGWPIGTILEPLPPFKTDAVKILADAVPISAEVLPSKEFNPTPELPLAIASLITSFTIKFPVGSGIPFDI